MGGHLDGECPHIPYLPACRPILPSSFSFFIPVSSLFLSLVSSPFFLPLSLVLFFFSYFFSSVSFSLMHCPSLLSFSSFLPLFSPSYTCPPCLLIFSSSFHSFFSSLFSPSPSASCIFFPFPPFPSHSPSLLHALQPLFLFSLWYLSVKLSSFYISPASLLHYLSILATSLLSFLPPPYFFSSYLASCFLHYLPILQPPFFLSYHLHTLSYPPPYFRHYLFILTTSLFFPPFPHFYPWFFLLFHVFSVYLTSLLSFFLYPPPYFFPYTPSVPIFPSSLRFSLFPSYLPSSPPPVW